LGFKICIISASFFPELSPRAHRTTELAKELSAQGHDLTVYIPFKGEDYLTFAKEQRINLVNLGNLNWQDIELKGGKIRLFVRRVMRRLLHQVMEWPDIELMFKVNKAFRNDIYYDLIISVAVPYPVHWGVALAGKSLHGCWIADCGDPYMGDTTDSFRKMFYFRYIEKWFCRKADYLTVPFEGARAAYYPEFHDKIRIIPQGFKIEDLILPAYHKTTNYPVFAYAGGFIAGKRDPRPMLEFLASYTSDFRFFIYTSQPEFLREAKIRLGDKLQIKSYIPRNELLIILSGMDFLVNLDNNVPTQLPSKLIDYAIAGRPVLNIRNDTDLPILAQFMEGDYSGKMLFDPITSYDIRNVARAFVNLFEESLNE
jgi:glycosyltransferase involved in cell wall biosynthesis